jgi:hypothetical protein
MWNILLTEDILCITKVMSLWCGTWLSTGETSPFTFTYNVQEDKIMFHKTEEELTDTTL